jgi:exodeoxyribonuclease-3
MSLRVITWNVNGFRSILAKGLRDFILDKNPEVLCIQEIKCDDISLIEEVFDEIGYLVISSPAKKKGYSGTLTAWKKDVPLSLCQIPSIGLDQGFLEEGRVIETGVDTLKIFNFYVPSGSSSEERQKRKYQFMDQMMEYFLSLSEDERASLVLCGDFNICHEEMDIHHPREATKKGLSGFLPEERSWFTRFLETGFFDVFRSINPEAKEYTWWSYRAGARGKNLGWRLDYFLCGKRAFERVQGISILKEVPGSDHCPVELTFKA